MNKAVRARNEKLRQESARRHIGERVVSVSGMEMELVAWRGSDDITVRFEDGALRECRYSAFKLGHVSPYPGRSSISIRKAFERVGETNIDKRTRMKMMISRYFNAKDISVRFEDGVEVVSSYSAFKRGTVGHPMHKKTSQGKKATTANHIGEIVVNPSGRAMTLTQFVSAEDVSVRFDDGLEINHISYETFKSGAVWHPLDAGQSTSHHRIKQPPAAKYAPDMERTAGTMIYGEEFKEINGTKYYKCSCVKCGLETYMTIGQMRRHNCHNKQNSTQEELKDLAEKIGKDMQFG
jgi:hypothetical protein